MRFRRLPNGVMWFNWEDRLSTCCDRVFNSKLTKSVDDLVLSIATLVYYVVAYFICFPLILLVLLYEAAKEYLMYLQWGLHLNSQETEEKIQAYIKRNT